MNHLEPRRRRRAEPKAICSTIVRFLVIPCRVGGGALSRWPPSAAQTARAVFPHTAFTMTRSLTAVFVKVGVLLFSRVVFRPDARSQRKQMAADVGINYLGGSR